MQNSFHLAGAVILGLAATFSGGSIATAPGQTPAAKQPAYSRPEDLANFRSRLQSATAKHLDKLIDPQTKVVELKGKSVDGTTALAFYQMYELTGEQKYRTAAVTLADRIVNDMRGTKHGVLYIKEKEAPGGDMIAGGGPPAFAWYASGASYVLHKEGGRKDDVKYLASVVDAYPFHESGWWANTIDVKTGQPKEPLSKPGAINKNAAMAMCAAMVAGHVKAIDAELSARLKAKADKCVYKQIIPVQEADGFWHYGLQGADPKNKDVIGYFMVTTHALIQLQQLTDSYRDQTFQSALDKAGVFAVKHIAPMTDPNKDADSPPARATAGTPAHYSLAGDELKRGFQLAILLFATKSQSEGAKILDCALTHFPHGNAGAEGAHAVHPSAMILSMLRPEVAGLKPKRE